MNRRKFLQRSALASTALFLPRFLNAGELSVSAGNRILVVVQLSGGNDALNTIVPFRNDEYYRLRPRLSINKDSLIMSGDFGFNSALKGIADLYNDGHAAVINNVGYPDSDRSHFRSMDIWQSASGADEYLNTGWIGRLLDAGPSSKCYDAIETDDTLSLALKGNRLNGLAVKNPERLFKNLNEGYYAAIAESYEQNGHHHEQASYLYKTLTQTISSADYIYKTSKIYNSAKTYPNSEFSKNLKTIAELIISGSATKVYYTGLSGFDTHIQQLPRQEQALKIFDEGLTAFTNELKGKGRFKDVLILAFSEFGRRVAQNASGGTDHGKAGTVFLFGNALKEKGMINSPSDLIDLDDGDIRYDTDFRNIYATIINKWLNADPASIFNIKTKLMNFI